MWGNVNSFLAIQENKVCPALCILFYFHLVIDLCMYVHVPMRAVVPAYMHPSVRSSTCASVIVSIFEITVRNVRNCVGSVHQPEEASGVPKRSLITQCVGHYQEGWLSALWGSHRHSYTLHLLLYFYAACLRARLPGTTVTSAFDM